MSAAPTGTLSYIAAGNIPAGGEDVGASIFGGKFSGGSWTPTNDAQGGPQPHDDNGAGNGGGPPGGHAAYAELGNGSAMGNLPEHTKLAITYNGKTVIAEKLDIGAGGGPVNGKPRVIDLWWETAQLLDPNGTSTLAGGTDVVNIRAVDPSTPTTPVNGQPATAPTAAQCCSSGSGSLTGKTPAEQAFNYFIGAPLNLSPQAAAGIVGNLMTESGGNTENLDTHAHNNISGTHDGIAQWSSTRWAALQAYENGNPYDLATQLDYIAHELQGSYSAVLNDLKSVTSASQAATIFNDGPPGTGYEVSGDTSGEREANATKIFGEYGSNAPGSGGAGTTGTGCPSASSGPVNIIKHDAFGTADGLMGHQPTMIGLHYTGANEQTVDQVVQDLSDPTGSKHCNKSCSVQLTIDPKGNVYQLTSSLDVVTENIINFNDADIGIEIMGADEQTLLNNTTQFNAVVSTVVQLMKQYNIKMVKDFSNKAGLMGHIECDTWSQAHLGNSFTGIYSHDPPVTGTDSHTDPGDTYMSKVRAAVGPQLN